MLAVVFHIRGFGYILDNSQVSNEDGDDLDNLEFQEDSSHDHNDFHMAVVAGNFGCFLIEDKM